MPLEDQRRGPGLVTGELVEGEDRRRHRQVPRVRRARRGLVAMTDEDDPVALAEVLLHAAEVVVRGLDPPGHAAGDIRGGDEEVVHARAREDVVEQLVRRAP